MNLRAALAVILASFVLVYACSAQQSGDKQDDLTRKYSIKPTEIKSSPTGVLIPKNLEEAFKELDKMLSPELKKGIKDGTENDLHMGLGMWIRNNWGLWKGFDLAKWFNKLGIGHPDNMSGIILNSYALHLNNKPIDLDGQVRAYRASAQRMRKAQEAEDVRAHKASISISKMMEKSVVMGKGAQTLDFPLVPEWGVRYRSVAKFNNSLILTAKEFRINAPKGLPDFNQMSFAMDLSTNHIELLNVRSVDKVLGTVVVGKQAFVHCVTKSRDSVIQLDGQNQTELPLPVFPKPQRLLELGIERDSNHNAAFPVAIFEHSIYRFKKGVWSLALESKDSLPDTTVPPELIGSRLYFRDEGRNEDDKRLSWIDVKHPDRRIFFDEHIGVVGQDGPRWENVFSYSVSNAGDLWLTAGSGLVKQSLIRWNIRTGYRIILIHESLKFDGELMDSSDEKDDPKIHAMRITGLETQPDGSVLAIGPRGLFRIVGSTIYPLLSFRKTTKNWVPTALKTIDTNTFIACGHWGGAFVFTKDSIGKYSVHILGQKATKP